MSDDGVMRGLWLSARFGCLSPLQQLKALVCRDVYVELEAVDARQYGLHNKIAAKLTKEGGGVPSRNAVRELLKRIDADPEWFPGKRYQDSYGPAPALNPAKRRCIAISAMALKASGQEPTFSAMVAQCPRAALNPQTKKVVDVVDKKIIYDVLREHCLMTRRKAPGATRYVCQGMPCHRS